MRVSLNPIATMSKFYKSLLTSSRTVTIFLVGLSMNGAAPWCRAQQPTSTSQPPKAFVRFWNMLPNKPTNNLVLSAGDNQAITAAVPNNISAEYLPTPIGSYSMVVKRTDSQGTLLQKVPVVLPEKGFISVLVIERNGQPAVEVINDTVVSGAESLGPQLVLRQFFPGAKISVSVNGGAPSQVVGYEEAATLVNVPASKTVNIVIQAVLPTTPPSTRTWPLTGDFSTARRATLLVVADTYGRLRPQLCYDGQLNAASASKP